MDIHQSRLHVIAKIKTDNHFLAHPVFYNTDKNQEDTDIMIYYVNFNTNISNITIILKMQNITRTCSDKNNN